MYILYVINEFSNSIFFRKKKNMKKIIIFYKESTV